jgi:ribonuclease-3
VTDKAESWLKESLDYQFADPGLLRQALTHRSAPGCNNERLEFLGDAVLDFVISEVVFDTHPHAPEGDLSRLRSSLVKDTSLARIANDIGLGEFLILGSGERKTGGHRRQSILADALEAIFGAVYLDKGFDAARAVIRRAFGERLQDFPSVDDLRDPKTKLQEWLQARQLGLPEYELLEVTGQPHKQSFEVSCRVGEAEPETRGIGTTRRKAEQAAARSMFERLTAEESA